MRNLAARQASNRMVVIVIGLMISCAFAFSITRQELSDKSDTVTNLIDKNENYGLNHKRFDSLNKAIYKVSDGSCGLFCYIAKIFDAIWWLIKLIFNFLISLPWLEIFEFIVIMTIVGSIILLFVFIAFRIWLKIRQGSDFDYNIFDDPKLTTVDKLTLNSIQFRIPVELQSKVFSYKDSKRKGEVIVEFKQAPQNFIALILDTCIGSVSSYKYFEVDIIENSKNSKIWIGLCEEEAFMQFELPDINYEDSKSTVILDGELSSLTTRFHK